MNTGTQLTLAVAIICSVSLPTHAQSQKIWTGNMTLSDFDCSREKSSEIVISGDVVLSFPNDNDPQEPAPWIRVYCDKLTFKAGSSLSIKSNLDLRISVMVSGPIKIKGLRGVSGSDANPTPGIWAQKKAGDGPDRAPAGDGQNAISTSWDYPAGRGSSQGGDGVDGGRGSDGANGTKGAFGKPGASGSSVNLLAGSFAPGTSIDITSRGGNGGAGGRGGRGEDGGNGGHGGKGGNGGKADLPNHAASRGGNGGRGGDGGNGGDGGPGGDGGNGGRGGDIVIGLKDGGGLPVSAPFFDNQGGKGGDPGIGGEGGLKGLRNKGGDGGEGGNGERWGIGTGGGPGGLAGAPGVDGVDGRLGPIGNPGKDGDRGNIGDGRWGTLPPGIFAGLMKS